MRRIWARPVCAMLQIYNDKYQQYDSVVSKLRENEADFKMLGERYASSNDEARKSHSIIIRQMYGRRRTLVWASMR